MATKIWVNIGSDYGLSTDGTKPLSEAMCAFPSLVGFCSTHPSDNVPSSAQATILHDEFENVTFKITATSTSSQRVNALPSKLTSHYISLFGLGAAYMRL